jgi:exodeoxyribonuclease VII small subunit
MSAEAVSYLENYQKLKRIAETMREQEELDIDKLVVMVEEATVAYKNCQARIEAVERTLGIGGEKTG